MDPLPTPICVDASLAVAFLLPDEASPALSAYWDAWVAQQRRLVVPYHFAAELGSAVRRAAVEGRIARETEDQVLTRLAEDIMPFVTIPPLTLATWQRVWAWAVRLRRSNLYDAFYLAVAEEAGAELWTTDENLLRSLEADGQPAPEWFHLLTP